MCIEEVKEGPWDLAHVPDHFKDWAMCNKAICGDPLSLQFVPDWFVRSKLLEMWHDDFGLNVDDEIDEC